jgi:hypothetical protein
MRKRGHIGLSTQLFRRTVSIEPKHLNPWMHFGAGLHDLHHYDAAMQVWDMLAKKSPYDAGVLRNMAGSFLQKGNFHEGLNKINQAIELLKTDKVPNGYMAIKGMSCLGLQRWEEGFKNYAGLYGDQITIRKYRSPEEPEWDGTPGKTVVVQGEQGIGDEIRFASVLPDMQKDCDIIFDCHPKLRNLFVRSFPGMRVFGTRKSKVAEWLNDNPNFDASRHISSLGVYYRKRDSDFPRKPFLTPSPELREKWREKLADYPRPLVGLAWTGGSHMSLREHRSFDLQTFIPIIQEGGTFVDLSYHDSREEVAYFNSLAENKVVRFDVDSENYDDTVALIAELDLVICVPTTILHAAGAIGKECWVYHPHYPFWEFGRDREDMIWYASGLVKLYRGTIEDLRDAYLHRFGQQAAASIHRAAELDNQESFEASGDNSSGAAPTAGPKDGPDRVHF